MFRAPFDSFHDANVPPFVEQLLSEESLRKTGYFDVTAVRHWRQAFRTLRSGSLQRTSVEMALVGILATQLWHHTFIDGSLADLPGASWDYPAGEANRRGPHRPVAAVAAHSNGQT
jgi:asparagine synthase (glutamine-hydrolysing)